ncbi:helix-turn-helix domain-containing protein, partial [Pseudomonas stutzeri]|nr:helix-turn-helix domain-containing protein [Stutzerimonas stutzeri]
MSPYTHLTLKDRESILRGISTGKTPDTIAKEIGRSKSTVSREIARTGGWRNYSAATAQYRYRRVRLA